MKRLKWGWKPVWLGLALLLSACGNGGTDDAAADPFEELRPPAATATVPSPPSATSTLPGELLPPSG